MKKAEEFKGATYRIPVRRIVGNTNPRYPFSREVEAAGYGIFESGSADLKPLWALATSDDAGERAEFVRVVQELDPEFCAWAGTFLTQGQLQDVEVRDNGRRADGVNYYTLVYGCRRCFAVLYNWCLLGKPAEPVVKAKMAKGSNAGLLHRAVVENTQRRPTVVEEAKAIRLAVNNGQTEEEVAREYGYSEDTVRKRLALPELEPGAVRRVREGTLSVTKALAGPGGGAKAGANGAPRVRRRKELEAARKEMKDDKAVCKVLDWCLGLRDDFR